MSAAQGSCWPVCRNAHVCAGGAGSSTAAEILCCPLCGDVHGEPAWAWPESLPWLRFVLEVGRACCPISLFTTDLWSRDWCLGVEAMQRQRREEIRLLLNLSVLSGSQCLRCVYHCVYE